MKEEQIQGMLKELFSKKFSKSYGSNDSYSVFVIEEKARLIVEQIIRGYLLENRDEKIGVLEAKVLTYEEIIKKSNFSAFIKPSEPELSNSN